MFYAEPALALATAGRDRDARQERWPSRLSLADLLPTSEAEWHRHQGNRSKDAKSGSEALFCRFEVDNVLDR